MSSTSPDHIERYARHLVLKEIGGAGQSALTAAHIAVIGAGGLGGPAALYLAAAGVGHITIIDDDTVSLSNLQRQIQFQTHEVGQAKTDVIKTRLTALNPNVTVQTKMTRINASNAASLLGPHDIILDGSDNFQTRFDVNAAAVGTHTPLISGALGRFDGQVSAFENTANSPCYRCLVPNTPPDAETCAQHGIVGALAGIIGSMMALEAIKIITGAGTPLYGRLYLYNGLSAQGRTVNLPKDPNCTHC